MIKSIIFDLDGVLFDSKDMHYITLNKALKDFEEIYGHPKDSFVINLSEHKEIYDGLPTKQKLKILTEQKNLDPKYHYIIEDWKQKNTQEEISKFKIKDAIRFALFRLQSFDYKLAVASNAIPQTVNNFIDNNDIRNVFTEIADNTTVALNKPDPLVYQYLMYKLQSAPCETLILEDSKFGLAAAFKSGACVMRIRNTDCVTYENIMNYIQAIEGIK